MNLDNPFKVIFDQLLLLHEKVDNLTNQPEHELIEKPINMTEASKILDLAEGTIYNNKDKIPHYKKYGKLYFFKSELIEYIRAGQKKTKEQIIQEVNQRLADLKKGAQVGRNQKSTPSKEQIKDKEFTLSDKIKITCTSAIEQKENIEDATEETANLHYLQKESELKEESEE